MPTTHSISVDVEDWYQSTIDPGADLSDRFETSTQRVLDAFASRGVYATFFVLGLAAEKCPELIKRISAAGHEVQSHGYGHRENWEMNRDELREDLLHAKHLLEDLTGREVFGYRAPCFSIDERNEWALDVIVETGHKYDSSIFPLKTSRYGIDGYPPEPRIVTTSGGGRLVEAPVACFTFCKRRLPVGGGGFFRLWPYLVIRRAWRQMDAEGRPGIVYMHPYEYDPTEMGHFKGQLSLKCRLHQGMGRKGFARKVDRLLSEFSFAPLSQILHGQLRALEA